MRSPVIHGENPSLVSQHKQTDTWFALRVEDIDTQLTCREGNLYPHLYFSVDSEER